MLVIIRDFSLPGNWKKNANVGQQTLIGTTNFEKKIFVIPQYMYINRRRFSSQID
jgi:hypothetical protein